MVLPYANQYHADLNRLVSRLLFTLTDSDQGKSVYKKPLHLNNKFEVSYCHIVLRSQIQMFISFAIRLSKPFQSGPGPGPGLIT
jgi:hypothetical protein